MSTISTKLDFKDVKKYIKDNGYKLYSKSEEYNNTRSKLLMECPKGHVVEMSFTTFKSGCRCRHCWKLSRNTGFHKKVLVLEKIKRKRKPGNNF
jgi:hypothetical protein